MPVARRNYPDRIFAKRVTTRHRQPMADLIHMLGTEPAATFETNGAAWRRARRQAISAHASEVPIELSQQEAPRLSFGTLEYGRGLQSSA